MHLSVRRVPWKWQHPVDNGGKYAFLNDDSYSYRLSQYNERKQKWNEGMMEMIFNCGDAPRVEWVPIPPDQHCPFEEIYHSPPIPQLFRPDWHREFCTCYQLYDAYRQCPLSPVCESPLSLARWCMAAVERGNLQYLDFVGLCFPAYPSPDRLHQAIREKASFGSHFKKLDICKN